MRIPATPETDRLLDYRMLGEHAVFALRAVRRNKLLAIAVFILVFDAALARWFLFPKTYHAEAKLLATRNLLMPALGNPGRAVPGDADAPTRNAPDEVMARFNLIQLVKQTHAVEAWREHRAPAVRARDWLSGWFGPEPTEQDRIDELVALLEKWLYVVVGDGTITIGLDWPDPAMAFQLVDQAQRNFVEARQATELSAITDSIAILEAHSGGLQNGIAEALNRTRSIPSTASTAASRPAASSGASNELALAQLRLAAAAKRRAIGELEEFRRRRLGELQAQLAEQRTTYAPLHPIIRNTTQSIAALSADSPQVAALRRELEELGQRYAELGGGELTAEDRPLAPFLENARRVAAPEARPLADEGAAEYARARLRFEVEKYEELLSRIDAARIELETSQAAFKYRYVLLRAAEVPKRVERPTLPIILVVGFIAGLVLAVAVAAARDLFSGWILASWQIERQLGLRVLAEGRRG